MRFDRRIEEDCTSARRTSDKGKTTLRQRKLKLSHYRNMKATIKQKPSTRISERQIKGRPSATARTSGSLGRQIRSILVPIDFSPPSAQALKYAAALATQFGAKITLLNVVQPVATPDFAYYPLMMENDKVNAQAKRELEGVPVSQGVDSNLIEKFVVRNGVPFHEITGAADSLKADLIVISTHGYTGLKHVLLGSTAERVVRHAPCPVLVVARPAKALAVAGKARPAPALHLGKILVPVDFSDCSGKALEYALPFAGKFRAAITLLHVVHVNYYATNSEYTTFDYPELIDEMRRSGEKELGQLADSVRKACPVKTMIETGHPGDVIVTAARKLRTGLIIISTHGRTGLKHAFLGSTAEYVVSHAPCPVLVVRGKPDRNGKT